MNNKYTYLNGNVILEDREGNEYITPNTDNMYDVVKQENYIEIIENKISDVQEEISEDEETIEEDKKTIKRKIITSFLVPLIIGLITSVIAFGLLKIGNINNNIFDYKALVKQESQIIKIMHFFNFQSLSSYIGIAFSAMSGLIAFTYAFFSTFVYMLEKKVTKLV